MKQLDRYLENLDCHMIERRGRKLNPEISYEEVLSSGEFTLDEMTELCGR